MGMSFHGMGILEKCILNLCVEVIRAGDARFHAKLGLSIAKNVELAYRVL